MLTGAAAVLAAGITAAPPRPRAHGRASTIRSAASRGGELLALTADEEPDGFYDIRHLNVGDDQRAVLGERAGIGLPVGFHPHSMAARGETLWVTGAVDELVKTVTVDNRLDALPDRLRALVDPDDADPALPDDLVDIEIHRARPALLRISGGRSSYAELPVPELVQSGVASGIALHGERGIAVAVEGSSDPEFAIVNRSHLLLSSDDGRTWRDHPVAEALGEGYGTVLTAAGGRLLAVTGDADGNQTLHSTRPGTTPELVAARSGAGRPMAAIPTTEGDVSVYSDVDGQVSESRFTADGRALESAGTACGCAGEVIAVQGRAGAWLEADGDAVRARGVS
ncbi:hypothetical protein GCM10028833_31830 [Glycomyces tarimensis]